ncbi:MAG: 3-dehydroquinate synthase, partial [Desulfomonilaceae bacterium]
SYFEKFGEKEFREAETGLLRKIALRKGSVVATGGGVPVAVENRKIMSESGKIIYLDLPLHDCFSRVGAGPDAVRPMWRDPVKVSELYDKRRAAYEDCDIRIDGSGKSAIDLSWDICERLYPRLSVDVNLGPTAHPLILTWRAPDEISNYFHPAKKIVVTDRSVSKFQMDRFSQVLEGATVVSLPPGERSKTLASAKRLYETMLRERLDRDCLLIAIGGGVITDLGAFVASTYKRGVKFVLISTSLVGCVDAAIGGKAAVDLNNVKNPVGCFTYPSAVVLDLRSLGSLPKRCVSEGLVEAYKTGLVADHSLARVIEDNLVALLKGDLLVLAEVVRLSALAKANIVGKDFKESGLRRILNFGHTYGHAVESFNNYGLSHGAAVAIGMMVAISISESRNLLSSNQTRKIQSTLSKFLKSHVVMPSVHEAWKIMVNDKKNRAGRITFVLLTNGGEPVYADDVKPEELEAAIQKIRDQQNE